MKKQIFSEIKDKIEHLVKARRLREAFSTTRSLAESIMNFEASDAVARAEETYRHMLRYAASGAEDPGRSEMAEQLGEVLLSTTDTLERANLMVDEPSLYNNVARFENTRPGESIASLIEEYASLTGKGSMFDFITGSKRRDEYIESLRRRENLETRLFNKAWVTHPLSAADAESLEKVFSESIFPEHFAILLTWAVTLGSLVYYDTRRLELLMSARAAASPRLQSASLIGLLLALNKGRGRYMPPRLRHRLEALKETSSWETDAEMAYKELTRTRDTDRITAKIRDEVVPEMMKLRPEISRRFSGELPVDPEDMEENPEWHELLEKSGISDKLREMSEIQEEGGDVMMGTFSHLKSFPFFHEVANWFLPFHTDRTELADQSNADLQPLADIISAMPMLCDSDKYSMMLSLTAAPAPQRALIMQQLNAQADQFNELRSAMLNTDMSDRRDLLRKQVQNLFRFFRLFRRKGEFPNPFAKAINLSGIPGLESLNAPSLVQVICEFYFSHGYYEEGLALAAGLGNLSEGVTDPKSPQAMLIQRMGYANMKLGNYRKALEYFEMTLLVQPDNLWVLKNTARCHMQTGNYKKAMEYFRQATALPGCGDDPVLTLSCAYCQLQSEQYDAAVKSYFKAEYLGANPKKVLRQLSWALLMNGDPAQSRRYLEKAMEKTGHIPNDYLNLGHIHLIQGNFKEALDSYRMNISARKEKEALPISQAVEGFISDIAEDTPALSRLGIQPDLLPLLTDSLLYSIE